MAVKQWASRTKKAPTETRSSIQNQQNKRKEYENEIAYNHHHNCNTGNVHYRLYLCQGAPPRVRSPRSNRNQPATSAHWAETPASPLCSPPHRKSWKSQIQAHAPLTQCYIFSLLPWACRRSWFYQGFLFSCHRHDDVPLHVPHFSGWRKLVPRSLGGAIFSALDVYPRLASSLPELTPENYYLDLLQGAGDLCTFLHFFTYLTR